MPSNSPKMAAAPLRRSKGLHPRNLHQQGYDLQALAQTEPALKPHLLTTAYGQLSINFSDPAAVKALNAALLQHHYGIRQWDIPAGYLCPPVPGREDYLHHLADLLADGGSIPRGRNISALDIGTGANGIYPLLGAALYGWRFVGSDIDAAALSHLQQVLTHNSELAQKITLRQQPQAQQIFANIMQAGELFDITLCNPPFHRSAAEAKQGSMRKLRNLAVNRGERTPVTKVLNFAGQANELWCQGGEVGFVQRMIEESKSYGTQVLWFTSLVSKGDNLPQLHQTLQQVGAAAVRTLAMNQGNKQSRILAWSFLDEKSRKNWRKFKV